MMRRSKVVFAALLAVVLPPAAGAGLKEFGACGNGRHADSLALQPATGNLVSAGMGRIAVHVGNVASLDFDRISVPYATRVLTADDGDRLIVRQDKTLYVYDFSTFERLGKRKVKVIEDQSFVAWRWVAGGDEIFAVSVEDRSGMFAMEQKLLPFLLRFDVGTGQGSSLLLELDGALRSAVFSPGADRVALALADGTVEVRTASTGALLHRYHPHGASPWNRYGMAFHPSRELLVTSDGTRIVAFDLAEGAVPEPWTTSGGGTFLHFLDGGRFMLVGDQTRLTFADDRGRPLETRKAPGEEFYREFHVTEPLKRVYTLGNDFVCWRTFEAWQEMSGRGGATP